MHSVCRTIAGQVDKKCQKSVHDFCDIMISDAGAVNCTAALNSVTRSWFTGATGGALHGTPYLHHCGPVAARHT